MTYTQKLITITETLTADRTLSDLAARLESNKRMYGVREVVSNVNDVVIELKACNLDADVIPMITAVESAISLLSDSLILLNTIVENDKLVETLFDVQERRLING